MNERIHNILDGSHSGKVEEGLFSDQADEQEFMELRALQQELRRNANADHLTAAEKSEIGAGVTAALGLPPFLSGTTSAPAASGSNWMLKSLVSLLVGVLLGAGGFALLDSGQEEPATVERVGIPVTSSTPAFFPFAIPELSPGAECDSLVTQLQDSIRALQQPAVSSKSTRKKRSSTRYKDPKVTPGTY